MKLFLDKNDERNTVTAYAHDHVKVNQERYEVNLVVLPATVRTDWATGGFDALTEADFEALAALGVEIVLIGTGSRQRFPAPALLRPLMQARIGFEVMDLGSACRTFNILAGEGRSVAAALIFDPA
ncbi:MAG: Mth938-like domain-containing protein [Rhodocyclaceae bacterium]|nr:Mth938-like domain-containing protein [Rhodocyclaceae bacterium]